MSAGLVCIGAFFMLIERILLRMDSYGAASQLTRSWRNATITVPRPIVLNPAPVTHGQSELMVPIAINLQRNYVSESTVSAGGFSFRYMVAPVMSIPQGVRYIGGSAAIPLFIDDSERTILVYRLNRPPAGLQLQMDTNQIQMRSILPHAVDSLLFYLGIFILSSSSSNNSYGLEFDNVKGVALSNPDSIFISLVTPFGGIGPWLQRIQLLVVAPLFYPRFATMLTQRRGMSSQDPVRHPRFISAVSVGTTTYFLDETHRMFAVRIDLAGHVSMAELQINGMCLFGRNISTLRSWLLSLNDGTIICMHYEYSCPSSYRFATYKLVLVGGFRWEPFENLGNCCVFIGWSSGAQAFAYQHPERIGLTSGRSYNSQPGMESYKFEELHSSSAIPPAAQIWPSTMWIHASKCVGPLLLPVVIPYSTHFLHLRDPTICVNFRL